MRVSFATRQPCGLCSANGRTVWKRRLRVVADPDPAAQPFGHTTSYANVLYCHRCDPNVHRAVDVGSSRAGE